MRSRWRIDDLVSIFADEMQKSTSGNSGWFSGSVHPGVRYYSFEKEPKDTNIKKAVWFAEEIVTRAINDDDTRWEALAKRYLEPSDENISEFYIDYLTLLSETMGEQMGILYKNRVYLYMFNFQNFTTLGEIVDFDVATFNATTFIDGTELSREEMCKNDMLTEDQLKSGDQPNETDLQAMLLMATIKQLTSLFGNFRFPGIINISSEEFQQKYDGAMKKFGEGFVSTGFERGYDPREIRRNVELIKGIETYFAESKYGLWSDYSNPIIDGLKGINRRIYYPVGRYLQKERRIY